MVEGRLGYNFENERYGVLVSDIWEDTGLHCGERLEVYTNDEWVKTRIEMGAQGEWYLVGTSFYGDLEYLKVRK